MGNVHVLCSLRSQWLAQEIVLISCWLFPNKVSVISTPGCFPGRVRDLSFWPDKNTPCRSLTSELQFTQQFSLTGILANWNTRVSISFGLQAVIKGAKLPGCCASDRWLRTHGQKMLPEMSFSELPEGFLGHRMGTFWAKRRAGSTGPQLSGAQQSHNISEDSMVFSILSPPSQETAWKTELNSEPQPQVSHANCDL